MGHTSIGKAALLAPAISAQRGQFHSLRRNLTADVVGTKYRARPRPLSNRAAERLLD
ncbi:MAG: hypothetical protein L0228_03820 [Planctomycetes bacterium]|nr:hypothetical protein [Planctomycetota bacterium]